MGDEPGREAKKARERRLLKDAGDAGAVAREICGDSEQQRAAAGQHHALACDGQAGFDHGLQSARAHDAGQRPAGKWKKTLARAGGEDELIAGDIGRAGFAFDAKHAGFRSIDDARAEEELNARDFETLRPGSCRAE